MPHPAPATLTTGSAGGDPFTVLVAKRVRFGRLAELTRSHHGDDPEAIGWLDSLVNALTDELEDRFSDRWDLIVDEVYAAEAGLLHLPYNPADPAGPPPFLLCPACRDLAAGHKPRSIPASRAHSATPPTGKTATAGPDRRTTPDATTREAS